MSDTHLSGDGERLEEIAVRLELRLAPGDARQDPDIAYLRDLATRLSPENDLRKRASDDYEIKRLLLYGRDVEEDGPPSQHEEELVRDVLAAFVAGPGNEPLSPENSSGVEEGQRKRARSEETLPWKAIPFAEAQPGREIVVSVVEGNPEAGESHDEVAVVLENGGERIRYRLGDGSEGSQAASALYGPPKVRVPAAAPTQPVSPQPDPTTRLSEGTGDELRKRLEREADNPTCLRCGQPESEHVPGPPTPPRTAGHLGATESQRGCCNYFQALKAAPVIDLPQQPATTQKPQDEEER